MVARWEVFFCWIKVTFMRHSIGQFRTCKYLELGLCYVMEHFGLFLFGFVQSSCRGFCGFEPREGSRGWDTAWLFLQLSAKMVSWLITRSCQYSIYIEHVRF